MGTFLSPEVRVLEKDLTTIVPNVATSSAAYIGASQWGPVNEIRLIGTQNNFVKFFGKPNDTTFKDFFTVANYLDYGNFMQFVRITGVNAKNATSGIVGSISKINITSGGTGYTTASVTIAGDGTGATATATIVGGVITAIAITSGGTGFTTASVTITGDGTGATATAALFASIIIKNETEYEAQYSNGQANSGTWAAKYPGDLGNSLQVSMADQSSFTAWTFNQSFDTAPGTSDFVANKGGSNDEMHIIVVDENGLWTGTAGTVLEVFPFTSKAKDAKNPDGTSNYYVNVINRQSQFVWWLDHTPDLLTASGTEVIAGSIASANPFASIPTAITESLTDGISDDSPTDGELQIAWSQHFEDPEQTDVELIPSGPASQNMAVFLINNISEKRRDNVVFISPQFSDVVNNVGTESQDIVAFRNTLPSSSYGVMDSGWKLQFDRYNDVNRIVPMNGDMSGLAARTDFTNDPWWSPAGFNRGNIKNVIKLPFNPNKTNRDFLYKNGVNPIVTFPGSGTILFGDKTMLSRPSAFDRINVRRLFLFLEKSISIAAKSILFEFNDEFTRNQARALVEPFLRDVQGRRGITDFKVIVDESNNTPEVIDRNEFKMDIFVKPARSVNFITLTFIASRSGQSFEEIGG